MGKRPSFSLVSVFLAAFILRLFLSQFLTLYSDFAVFLSWSERLVDNGFYHFYEEWSDYLPGYLYVLWFLGKLRGVFPEFPILLLYKLPAIVADLFTGFFIFLAVSQFNKKWALPVASLYLFNPAVFANSTLWGQVDGITAFFGIASVFLVNKLPLLSPVFLSIGTLVKPQAGFIAPFLVLLWLKQFGLRKTIGYTLISVALFLEGFVLFANAKPLLTFVIERLTTTAGQYPYTSVNAFNLWALIHGFWRPDGGWHILGTVFTTFSLLFILGVWSVKKENGKQNLPIQFLITSLFFAIPFLFLTRMHERHLLPILAPLIVASASRPFLLILYTIFSLTYLANLYFSYIWLTENFRFVFSQGVINFFSLANLVALGIILFSFLKGKTITLPSWELKTKVFQILSIKNAKIFLGGILVFVLLTRIFGLSHPQTFYFDEVYHAWTAREMLRGNTAAWEWWNTPPPGFAYEWTHPPLAKLGMAAGMLVFGENPLGWRILGALFGVGSVLLVYLIGAFLFKNKTAALLASAIFALDGLPLVMSRIGMNDSYFLFFALATIYFFLNKKIFLSSLMLGLALSSKWTAFWLVPILVGGLILFKRKPKFEYLLFLVIPSLIYVFSYLPFFASGHSFSQFIELQGQMWWYHTGLAATHPFQSSWWSWPILYRPIWLFTQTRDALVSNIYAMGNPLIFWFGLIAVLLTGIKGVLERNNKLLFLIVAYLGFFLPWALSPRIMFLYHYLPSLPFLALSSGWLFSRLWARGARLIVLSFLIFTFSFFIFFYPHWTGIFVPRWLDNLYYWLPSWR